MLLSSVSADLGLWRLIIIFLQNFYSSLLLELSWIDDSGHSHRVFVGWAGGASSANSAIEIPSPFAVSLGLPNRQKVASPSIFCDLRLPVVVGHC